MGLRFAVWRILLLYQLVTGTCDHSKKLTINNGPWSTTSIDAHKIWQDTPLKLKLCISVFWSLCDKGWSRVMASRGNCKSHGTSSRRISKTHGAIDFACMGATRVLMMNLCLRLKWCLSFHLEGLLRILKRLSLASMILEYLCQISNGKRLFSELQEKPVSWALVLFVR